MQTNADSARLSQAQGFLDRVIGQLRVLQSPQKDMLIDVLQYLSDHIRATRREIGALRGGDGQQLFGNTADELEEIVTETARAANRIMDAAETVERVAAGLEGPPAAALMDAVTNIYEASAFQDITGQRITKAIRAFQAIERHVMALVEASGEAPLAPAAEDGLVNGPQLAGRANSQADIDRLLESLG